MKLLSKTPVFIVSVGKIKALNFKTIGPSIKHERETAQARVVLLSVLPFHTFKTDYRTVLT